MVVPVKLTNEKLLELEQKLITDEESREKETTGEEKEDIHPKKIYSEGFSQSFCTSQQSL